MADPSAGNRNLRSNNGVLILVIVDYSGSLSFEKELKEMSRVVLILVIVDYSGAERNKLGSSIVLILVIVDYSGS